MGKHEIEIRATRQGTNRGAEADREPKGHRLLERRRQEDHGTARVRRYLRRGVRIVRRRRGVLRKGPRVQRGPIARPQGGRRSRPPVPDAILSGTSSTGTTGASGPPNQQRQNQFGQRDGGVNKQKKENASDTNNNRQVTIEKRRIIK